MALVISCSSSLMKAATAPVNSFRMHRSLRISSQAPTRCTASGIHCVRGNQSTATASKGTRIIAEAGRSRVAPRRTVPRNCQVVSAAGAHMSLPAPHAGVPKPDEHYDVVVVGGGPAGLLAANALLTALPGASVKVFEAAPGYRPQGAGVLIEVNGWRALHAVDGTLAERLRSRGILLRASKLFDEAGRLLPFQPPATNHEANIQAHGHTSIMIHWGDIRQLLFEALPEGTVSFSNRLVGMTPGELGGPPAVLELQEVGDGQGQTVTSRDAASATAPTAAATRTVTAGLVVAADGYYSRCKRLAFDASIPPLLPTFRDRVVWRALVAYPDHDQMPVLLREAGSEATSLWWMGEGQVPERLALVYPVNDNRFVWTCFAPVADIEAAGLPPWLPHRLADQDLGIQQTGGVGSDPKQRCLAVFRNYPSEVLDLLSRTDSRAITEHGYYTHDMETMEGAANWVRGNVVLVGDAAHTGAPDGQGLNMAWEDVAVLAAELGRRGLASREALDAYCEARLPRVHTIWAEKGMQRPQRAAGILAAAFTPLGPGSSGADKTAPLSVTATASM